MRFANGRAVLSPFCSAKSPAESSVSSWSWAGTCCLRVSDQHFKHHLGFEHRGMMFLLWGSYALSVIKS